MMLKAKLNGEDVHIWNASHGCDYRCSQCGAPVVPHLGPKVTHHFKHKPGAECSAGSGETMAHLEAKEILVTSLMNRGLQADVEVEIKCLSPFGGRRADVLVKPPPPREERVAIELQRASIQLDEFERRTKAYRDEGVNVMWIPFAEKKTFKAGEAYSAGATLERIYVERYSARPWEKHLHELMGEVWYYDPDGKGFWLGEISPCMIDVPYSEYYTSDGDPVSHGGYERESKRWVELKLVGPYSPDDLLLKTDRREGLLLARFIERSG